MRYEVYIYNKARPLAYLKDAADEYTKRLSRYCKTGYLYIKKEKIWEKTWNQASDRILILPGKGSVSSEAFSRKLESLEMEGKGSVSFFIPDPTLLREWCTCQMTGDYQEDIINLSDFTMSSSLTGVVLLEQIYRGYRIMHHHPYHK